MVARVGAVMWLFILLVFVPTVLYGLGAGAGVLAYLFALNLIAGYTFWMRRRLGGLGQKSMALIYLASGVCFFAFLIDPVKIDSTRIDGLKSLSAWQAVLDPKPESGPVLAGTPVEQMSVKQRAGTSDRPWLDGLIEDVVRRPEEPRKTGWD